MNKLFQLFPNIKVRIWQAGPNMHILSDPVTVMITNMKFSQIFRRVSRPGRPCVVPTSVNFWEMHLV